MKELVKNVGKCGQDNLIAGLFPRALTMPVKIAAGEGLLQRGTLLTAKSDGTYVVCGKKETTGEGDAAQTTTYSNPGAILTDAVDASGMEAVAAVAYRNGNFNPDAVIVAEGYTLTAADKDILRKYDIIFTQVLPE
ncbi:MAG: head decoration protein [Oscillospiraceae bacterium]|nr:head decoration protein [Oscillospiraceae bacterium]